MSRGQLTLSQARRIALAAQGFAGRSQVGDAAPRVDRRHGRRLFDQVAIVQIDSVNVLCRSQELPLLARLGPHPRTLIPRMTAVGDLFEYWAHEASHVPVALHPLLRWRMSDARDGVGTWGGIAHAAHNEADFVGYVRDQVADRGPITIGMLEGAGERGDGMWGWSPGKVALEYLFWSGQISARRGENFERWYDVTERMLPADILALPTPSRAEALKELLLIAARSHGIGTARDLADYFRLKVGEARPLLVELVDEGRLEAVRVQGWKDGAYLNPGARLPRQVRGRALLSPFDSLIWERSRTERLWGFRYRLEIYVPQAKRVHGYYVLPFLLDGELVARVDLKSDRQVGVLRVRASHGEHGIDIDHVSSELAAELMVLARFLGLTGGVAVEPLGDLAGPLAAAVARAG